jgi:hypothetical protein
MTPRDNAHVTIARPVTGKNNDSSSTTATESEIPKAGNHRIQSLESTSWLVKCSQSVTLSPRAKQIIKGRLLGFKHQVSPGLVCVEPAQLAYTGHLCSPWLIQSAQGKPRNSA